MDRRKFFSKLGLATGALVAAPLVAKAVEEESDAFDPKYHGKEPEDHRQYPLTYDEAYPPSVEMTYENGIYRYVNHKKYDYGLADFDKLKEDLRSKGVTSLEVVLICGIMQFMVIENIMLDYVKAYVGEKKWPYGESKWPHSIHKDSNIRMFQKNGLRFTVCTIPTIGDWEMVMTHTGGYLQ